MATASHGSSLSNGSISGQLTGITIVGAQVGKQLYKPLQPMTQTYSYTQAPAFYGQQAAVGQTGVIFEVVLNIVATPAYSRIVSSGQNWLAFLNELKNVESNYSQALTKYKRNVRKDH